MKQLLLITCLSISPVFFGQINVKLGFTLTDGETMEVDVTNGKDVHIQKSQSVLKEISIVCTLAAKHELRIRINGETKIYKDSYVPKQFSFIDNIIGNVIMIEYWDNSTSTPVAISGDNLQFRIINDLDDGLAPGGGKNDEDEAICVACKIDTHLKSLIDKLEIVETPIGLYRNEDNSVHLFFDQYGNNLFSTVPQGVSNAKYVVHVIYPYYGEDDISYSVKQKSGTFNSGLTLNNSGIKSDVFQQESGKDLVGIGDRQFLLGTSTDDLSFDIIATTNEGKTFKKTVLESYTIKMSPVYHASFDVGLLRTNLLNPTFSLVQSPNSSDMVVKETNAGPSGVVTIMASFYTSPVILIENAFRRNKKTTPFPRYKLYGRNFLDDHRFYERIYPTVGVSISSRTFENLFFGFNFEVARGLNIFGGWHLGKVNVFEMPDYKAGETPVTQAQFDFYTNTRWRTSTTFGVKLDALIIKGLFGN